MWKVLVRSTDLSLHLLPRGRKDGQHPLALEAASPVLRSLSCGVIYGCIIQKSVRRCKQGDCASVRY
jgi:hypothetical protein